MQIPSKAYTRRLRMDMNPRRNEFGPPDLLGFSQPKPPQISASPSSRTLALIRHLTAGDTAYLISKR